MPSRCGISGCSSSSKSLHRIQKIEKFPHVHEAWVAAADVAGRRGNPNDLRICSRHFTANDYQGKILKKDAIPTQNLGGELLQSITLRINSDLKSQQHCVNLPGLNVKLEINIEIVDGPLAEAEGTNINVARLTASRPLRGKTLKITCTALRAQLRKARMLSKKNMHLKKFYYFRYVDALKLNRNAMKQPKAVKKLLANAKLSIHKSYHTKLRQVFTERQVRKFLSSKRTCWSSEEIASGITLRYKSNTYDELVKRGFPFPSTRTLQRWTHEISFPPGFLQPVLSLLKEIFKNQSWMMCQAVICFDEVGLDARYSYNPEEDKIYAGKANMTVFIVRGLFYPWKQIVAYDFDGTVTVEKFTGLVASLENCGLQIRAAVSDMGGKNMSLWKSLNIKVEKCKDGSVQVNNFTKSPVNNNKIFFFADVPHLLKNLRNNILSHGVTLADGETIGLEDFRYVLKTHNAEISTTHKVSDRHLDVKMQVKQRVHLAAELLSGSVATAFDRMNRKRAANFIRTVNDSFDVMNSRYLHEQNDHKKPYGLALDVQNDALRRMENEMSTMRVGSSKSLFPFQKGYLLSIKSLRDLFEEMKTLDENIDSVYANRCNQDCLENAFSELRGMCGFSQNPTATDAIRRLKLLMLSKSGTLSKGTVVRKEDDYPFLTGQMLETLMRGGRETHQIELEIDISHNEDEEYDETDPITGNNQNDDRSSAQEINEEAATQIVAGYVAYKLKNPALKASDEEQERFKELGWYKFLNSKGYTIPSEKWQSQVKILNQEFFRFHGQSVSGQGGAMIGFSNALQRKYPDIPACAVLKFVKLRTYIRMRYLNKESAAIKLQQSKMIAEKMQRLQDRHNERNLKECLTSSVNEQRENTSGDARSSFSFLYHGEDFDWCSEVKRIGLEVFGHANLTELQTTAINVTMSGLDCLLIMPTGSGKSLVYQICCILTKGVTLVISPLVSLIKDQTMSLRNYGIECIGLTSSASEVEDLDTSKEVNVVLTSPEMLAKSKRLQIFLDDIHKKGKLDRFVLDEAHCLVEWGGDFRQDYDALSALKGKYPLVPILGLTATATMSMGEEICKKLNMSSEIVLRDSSCRTNLSYSVELVTAAGKNTFLVNSLLNELAGQCGIIYCLTVKECEQVKKLLLKIGIKVETYHAKLSQALRNRVQEEWYSGKHLVIVATTAFGMGINKQDCRFVIHYSIPSSLINYQQETGRAGRDASVSTCILLLSMQDVFRALSMFSLNDGGRSKLLELLKYVVSQEVCRQHYLKRYFGVGSEETDKCTTCDNCKAAETKISNLEPLRLKMVQVLDIATEMKVDLTARNLVDILFGKNRKQNYLDVIPLTEVTMLFTENVVLYLLSEGYLCEKLIIAGRTNYCCVIKGGRNHVDGNEISYFSKC